MFIRLLGPVDVLDGDVSVPVPGARRRAVLATLALGRGTVVSTDRLVEAVWGSGAPLGASTTLQSHVSYLRKVLGGREAIISRPPGYLLVTDTDGTDVDVAERLVGREAQSPDPATRARHLRAALRLWRGRALLDVARTSWFDEQAGRLDDLRLRARRGLVDASLELGEHAQVLPELELLVREFPFDEWIHGQLMVALYRMGRQSDALGVCQRLRSALVEDLGVEAGPALRDLEVAILRHDPALEPAPPAGLRARQPVVPPADPAADLPAQLPLAVPSLAGRSRHLSGLDALLDHRHAGTVVATVSGPAGAGKTALAVHWAHKAADHFPDGQLYVNLRGFDPTGQAVDPAQALRGLLEALGVPVSRIPGDVDALAATYRSTLAGRRVLVLLDNACDSEQVRPLLPGSPGCMALVTSRDQLTGLTTAEAAVPVTLELLSAAEARELLELRLGTDRVAAEPDGVEEILRHCAGLPLALAIVAARAATRPDFTLAVLAAELRGGVLDVLQGGDATTDLRAVFCWSYRAVSPTAATMFRLLSLHPGPDIGRAVAASLAGVPLADARAALGELLRAHLLTEHTPSRYVLHDLLRAYALELAHEHDSAPVRRTALARMFDHFLHTARPAAHLLAPHLPAVAVPAIRSGVTTTVPGTAADAVAWFTLERRVVLAVVELCAVNGFDVHAWQLAWSMTPFLHPHGHWYDQGQVARTALAAGIRLGDPLAQAFAQRAIAGTHAELGQLDEAELHYGLALELFEKLDLQEMAARVHQGLAWVSERQNRPAAALHHADRAVRALTGTGPANARANALNGLGWAHALCGDYPRALEYCEQALAACRDLGDRAGVAYTWDSLGYIRHQLGEYREAVRCYHLALDLLTEVVDPSTEAEVLTHLSEAHDALADPVAARAARRRALGILDQLDAPPVDRLRARLLSAEAGRD
ncbi:BTAD domain-containing putative transcriptional regulator [Longispora sp. NPDC051575]|uniref:AfsR/SARP family transcriptional regulator n=1 Tax=Longispora sp. NPDC051575 TaxID=3154943 RepID=UPI00341BEE2E